MLRGIHRARSVNVALSTLQLTSHGNYVTLRVLFKRETVLFYFKLFFLFLFS